MPKFCISTTSTIDRFGVPIELIAGRAYDSDDPVVVALPHLFADTPTVYDTRGNVVEQATAAPGEKRQVRRG